MAYMAVQFAAILLLVLGVYRFAILWVNPRAASFAALASVFIGSESFLVYSAGQLGTTSAAPIYLNALPYLLRMDSLWKVARVPEGDRAVRSRGRRAPRYAALRITLFCAARAGAGISRRARAATASPCRRSSPAPSSSRVVVGAAIAIGLLPFWIALIHYPVTQTPIPHPSSANYILSPNGASTISSFRMER